MYQGTNPTALLSQKMITEALLALMQEKSFAKINVKELCERALVSRQTFYALFQTKEQVIELYFDRLFQDYTKHFSVSSQTTVSDICSSAITYLTDKSEFICLLTRNNLSYMMIEKFKQYLLELGEFLHLPVQPQQEYAMAFMAGALVELISHHMKSSNPIHTEELSQLVEQILTGQYFQV